MLIASMMILVFVSSLQAVPQTHHDHNKRDTNVYLTLGTQLGQMRLDSLSSQIVGNNKLAQSPMINKYVSGRKSSGRKFNVSWVQGDDNLSPEYSALKKVACRLDKIDMMQISMIQGLIVTAANLPPSRNPVIRCNKERIRNKQSDDIGIKDIGDFSLEKIKKLCDYPQKWIEFEHCILSKLRNNDDYITYQDTLKKALLILASNAPDTQSAPKEQTTNNSDNNSNKQLQLSTTTTTIRIVNNGVNSDNVAMLNDDGKLMKRLISKKVVTTQSIQA